MELYLQFGYGMMGHIRHLLERWNGGTAILSPRDLTDVQLRQLSDDLRDIDGGKVLLDPQFFLPHADHERLCAHDYWPNDYWPNDYETGVFWQGPALAQLIDRIYALNADLGTSAVILPGLLATQIDDGWLSAQTAFLDRARSVNSNQDIMMTIALNSDVLRDQRQVGELIEAAETWRAPGYYLVFEHPNGEYLVSDSIWLANALDIVAGLRLMSTNVVVGYSNHQMLVAGLSGATAIASGTWMNVRSFPPDKFRANYEEEIRQRATWYYCSASMSEYKITFLDAAQRMNVLDTMAPMDDGGYADILFSGAQPTSTNFGESNAFRHYLNALRSQADAITKPSFDSTVDDYQMMLDQAEATQGTLHAAQIRGQQRDFGEYFDINRAAIAVLTSTRGQILKRSWGALT